MGSSADRVRITKIKVHQDARGAVFEPLEPELLNGWRNVHAVLTEPGAVRGNHRHLRGTEMSSVGGAALVRRGNGVLSSSDGRSLLRRPRGGRLMRSDCCGLSCPGR